VLRSTHGQTGDISEQFGPMKQPTPKSYTWLAMTLIAVMSLSCRFGIAAKNL